MRMARKKVPVRKSINDESQPHIKDRLVEIGILPNMDFKGRASGQSREMLA